MVLLDCPNIHQRSHNQLHKTKAMHFKAALLLFTAEVTYALIGNDWSIEPTPPNGLQDVAYPFNMGAAPHISGYYFAQQYRFNNIQDVGYTGLQPRSDQGGKSIIHGVFSSFQKGTTTNHPNCHDGADSGPGVSCAIDISGDYSHTYHCIVENIGNTTWRGTLLDTVTGVKDIIGEWTLPEEAGGIKGSEGGFIEYYPWNDGKDHSCDSLPQTEVTFGDPITRTDGAGKGQIPSVYEYGGCEGRAGFVKEATPEGWHLQVGF